MKPTRSKLTRSQSQSLIGEIIWVNAFRTQTLVCANHTAISFMARVGLVKQEGKGDVRGLRIAALTNQGCHWITRIVMSNKREPIPIMALANLPDKYKIIPVNVDARDYAEHLYVLAFGSYGETKLAVWADNIDDALETAGNWFKKNSTILGMSEKDVSEKTEEWAIACKDPSEDWIHNYKKIAGNIHSNVS